MTFAHYARAALHVYLNARLQMSREDWHLFITLADLALAMCTSQNPCNHEVDEMVALLQCMDEALEMALQPPVRNCGYYDQLPWISTLATRPTTMFKCMPPSLPPNLRKIDQFSCRHAARETLDEVQGRWNRMAKSNKHLTCNSLAATTSVIAEVASTNTTVSEDEGCSLSGAAANVPSSPATSPQATSPQTSVTTQFTSTASTGYAISVSSATSEDDLTGVEEGQPCTIGVTTVSHTSPESTTQTDATLPRDVQLGESRLPTGSVRGPSSGLYHTVPTDDDDDHSSRTS